MIRMKPKILIVDDKTENLYTLEMLLRKLDVEVVRALSGAEALALTLEHDFCVAIVDIQMPEMDGYELVELLRSNADTADLPAIFVSAIYSDEYHHRKGYDAGAVDFLSKPFIPEILISKVKIFIDLYLHRKALEEEVQQRRQAEQALQAANKALAMLNADKDRFFSIISHDLRSPFNVVMGNAQLLSMSINRLSPEDIQEMAQSILEGAKNAYNLLDNLLTWSRLQREGGMQCHPEQMELRRLAEDTLAVFVQVADNKEIELCNEIPNGIQIQADRYMMETVIRNLTGNALKFTPRHGKVTVAACADNGQAPPNFISVLIQDTGIGMSQGLPLNSRLLCSLTAPGKRGMLKKP
jgi:signal transduction histidine kinase